MTIHRSVEIIILQNPFSFFFFSQAAFLLDMKILNLPVLFYLFIHHRALTLSLSGIDFLCWFVCMHGIGLRCIDFLCCFACMHGIGLRGIDFLCCFACMHGIGLRGIDFLCCFACMHGIGLRGIDFLCCFACMHGIGLCGIAFFVLKKELVYTRYFEMGAFHTMGVTDISCL